MSDRDLGDASSGQRPIEILATTSADTINASSTEYYPDTTGIDIAGGYRLITIVVNADYALTGAVEVSDDETNWYQYYPADGTSFTLTASRLKVMSFEEDFLHVRLKLSNGDGSSHTVNLVTFKGSR